MFLLVWCSILLWLLVWWTAGAAIPILVTPAIDAASLAAAATAEGRIGEEAPQFAVPFDTQSYSAETNGVWEATVEGGNVWRLIIQCPGAIHVNLGFTSYRMPPGGTLTISNSDESKPYSTTFTSADNNAIHGELWTPVYLGDTVTLQVSLPPNVPITDLQLIVGSINAGFLGFGGIIDDPSVKSGSCNVDVTCPEGDEWRKEISSVAVYSLGGTRFCTGTLINTVQDDKTPYFLTAYHCGINSSPLARSLVVYWNYETKPCGQTPPNGNLTQFQQGATVVAGWATSDFSLLLLDNKPNETWNIHYAGWDRSGANMSRAIAIHHPQAQEKRISLENDPTSTTSYGSSNVSVTGTHIRVADWDLGTTEPGSSGSPLFDANHRIVGQLHGGTAACSNNASDWYGRIFQSWEGNGSPSGRLKDWLDPKDTGAWIIDTGPIPAPQKEECSIFLWLFCFIIDLVMIIIDFVVGSQQ